MPSSKTREYEAWVRRIKLDTPFPTCPCGGPTGLRPYQHFVRAGASVVPVLITAWKCCKCGEDTVMMDELVRAELLAARIVLVPFYAAARRPSDPAVMRFARKALGCTKPELAERLGRELREVEQWEEPDGVAPPGVAQAVLQLLSAEIGRVGR